MRAEYWVWTVGLAWLVNAVATVAVIVPKVESDLQTRIDQTLETNALSEWKAKVTGLDVALVGPRRIPGQEHHAEEPAAIEAIQSVPGVRKVIEVRYAEATPSARPETNRIWFEIRRTGDEVRVAGDFSTPDQKDAAIAPLLDWFQDMNVNDAASVDQRLTAPFDPGRAIRTQSWMSRPEVPNFRLRYEGGILTIDAEVSLAQIAELMRKQLKAGFPNTKLDDKISITGRPTTANAKPLRDLKKLNRPVESLFAGDRLSEPGKAYLARVAPLLKGSGQKVKVGVHADPAQAKPLAWTKLLANQVRTYLVAQGVPGDRLSAEGFGAKVPNPGGARRRVTFQTLL